MTDEALFLRLGIAVLAGLDRELRGISAGIRTHALVSLSSAVITVSAMLLYEQLHVPGNVDVDPLRVVQGLAQAIGFIAAGVIFVSKGDVHNLTSAANIWLAAALGIAAGLGQFNLLGMALGLAIVIVTGLRLVERLVPRMGKGSGE